MQSLTSVQRSMTVLLLLLLALLHTNPALPLAGFSLELFVTVELLSRVRAIDSHLGLRITLLFNKAQLIFNLTGFCRDAL